MRYSNDLRNKAINLLLSGKSQAEVYTLLNIGENTIYRWHKQYKNTRDFKYKSNYSTGRPNIIKDKKLFEDFLISNNHLSLNHNKG